MTHHPTRPITLKGQLTLGSLDVYRSLDGVVLIKHRGNAFGNESAGVVRKSLSDAYDLDAAEIELSFNDVKIGRSPKKPAHCKNNDASDVGILAGAHISDHLLELRAGHLKVSRDPLVLVDVTNMSVSFITELVKFFQLIRYRQITFSTLIRANASV
jgi:hypothetical protein